MRAMPSPLGDDEMPDHALRAPALEGSDDDRASGVPAWFISAAVHALAAMIFWGVAFVALDPPFELPPMRPSILPLPPKPVVTTPVTRTSETKPDLEVPVEQNPALVDAVVLITDERTDSENDVVADSPKGREEAVANSEAGATGVSRAIGAAAFSSGLRGTRTGGGKRRAIAKGGGTYVSERAVDAALNWFKRHQSANGMWDVEKYQLNCSEAPKCEPGSTGDSGGSDANVAMTGYAVLCFLGAGYDHKAPNRFRTTVQKGLEYLRSVQKADGLLGARNYEHAVATMALAEAYAMTSDPDLKQPAQDAIKAVLARQSRDAKAADAQYSGLGWDYTDPRPERNDSSVSGWNVMALKSGLAAGLDVGHGMMGAKTWLERAWKAANKDWAKLGDPYSATSSFPYTWDAHQLTRLQIDLARPAEP